MTSESKRERRFEEALLLLVLGCLVCLAFLNSPGTDDRDNWTYYMDVAREKGILAAYYNAANVDYPPLGFPILGVLARIADVLNVDQFTVLKFSLAAFVLACAGVAAALRRDWQPAVPVAMFLTLVVDAVLETYLDVYFLLFLLLAVYCFERGYKSSGAALFAISSLIKWQPIILTPLVVLYVLPRRPRITDFARLVPALVVGLAVCSLYARPMIIAFIRGFNEPMLSGYALNFNWLITGLIERHKPAVDGLVTILRIAGGFYLPLEDGHGPTVPTTGIYPVLLSLSSALRYFCYAVSLCYFYGSDRSLINFLRASIACFMAYFIFGASVHENHACVPAALAICWFAMDRARYLEAIMLAAMFNLNLLIFYGLDGNGLSFSRVVGWDVTLPLAAFNVVLFMLLWLPLAGDVLSRFRATATRVRAQWAAVGNGHAERIIQDGSR